ncbi:Beta-barrel assembly machine subunit BamE [Nitrosomonas ureae]|uniref:Beta-barrel assembly machine subunit BamE n=1 Tax=Nitrosomonas ureae TaxID=44577 RepID=A0A285BUD6_9PROT|nr:Beta-barrel assembly machine subunit BamE [Nitrosomonas ureae]
MILLAINVAALKRKLLIAIPKLVGVMAISGCSVFMAAKQPEKKDIDLLQEGVTRTQLISEFGAPVISEYKNGKRFEIFKFVQGYSTGAKAGRAFLHGAANVATLGLWELVGTPTEITFSGNDMAFQVQYDESDVIEEVVIIKKE